MEIRRDRSIENLMRKNILAGAALNSRTVTGIEVSRQPGQSASPCGNLFRNEARL